MPSLVPLDPLLVLHCSPYEKDDTSTDPFLSNAGKKKRKRRNISKRYQPDVMHNPSVTDLDRF